MSFKQHKEAMLLKVNSLLMAFHQLRAKIVGPMFRPLLQTIQAKLVPTLVYGSEASRGRDGPLLDKIIVKTCRSLFCLPLHTSASQLRLEFGLAKQA